MARYRIAVVAGDGIGPEVIAEALKVLEALAGPELGLDFDAVEAGAPGRYDIVVTENMFGDILSDLAAATVGGLGLAPSGDIGEQHGLFQPSHGTAPDIAGKGIANPVAAILSAGLLLEWLARRHGDAAAAQRVERAVVSVLGAGRVLTSDLGGGATAAAGDAVAAAL